MKNPDFTTGSCSFDLEPGESAFSHLEQQDYYGHDRIRRMVAFLHEVGIVHFDITKLCEIENENACARKLMRYCNPFDESEIGWDCHQASSYMALRESEANLRWTRLFFGFVYQKFPGSNRLYCMLHSWVADEQLFFVDPKLQANCDDERHLVTRLQARGEWLDLKRPRIILGDFYGYHGVEIPLIVARDALQEVTDKSYGHLWRHLNRHIFITDIGATWFTNVVKNGGEGWVYQPDMQTA